MGTIILVLSGLFLLTLSIIIILSTVKEEETTINQHKEEYVKLFGNDNTPKLNEVVLKMLRSKRKKTHNG